MGVRLVQVRCSVCCGNKSLASRAVHQDHRSYYDTLRSIPLKDLSEDQFRYIINILLYEAKPIER